MTLREAALGAYAWLVAHDLALFVTAVAVPMVGSLLALIGRGGRTDRDGKRIASVVVGVGLLSMVALVVGVFVGRGMLGARLWDADLAVVLAPVFCFAGSLLGIHWVFPLNQLATVRTAVDVGLFVAACVGVVWFLGQFRGWGLVFFGSLTEMVAIAMLGFYFMRKLHRRAFQGQGAR